jgi:acetyl esterase/lipase
MAEAQFLGPQEVHQLPSSPADHRIHYGKDPLQFGDLRLPKTSGRHPVIIVIHGGCWKSKHGALVADLQDTAALSSALTHLGIATWNIEYRQIDNPGGDGQAHLKMWPMPLITYACWPNHTRSI